VHDTLYAFRSVAPHTRPTLPHANFLPASSHLGPSSVSRRTTFYAKYTTCLLVLCSGVRWGIMIKLLSCQHLRSNVQQLQKATIGTFYGIFQKLSTLSGGRTRRYSVSRPPTDAVSGSILHAQQNWLVTKLGSGHREETTTKKVTPS
jgi:hypothetical protein